MKIQAKAISKELRQIKKTLASKFNARQVILFGSYAYGQPDAESDLDVCVILDLRGKRKIELMREMHRELASFISLPVDILVYSEQEFSERASLTSTLEHKILTQGIQLYEQSRSSERMV